MKPVWRQRLEYFCAVVAKELVYSFVYLTLILTVPLFIAASLAGLVYCVVREGFRAGREEYRIFLERRR